MKLEINNKNGIVTGAFIDEKELSFSLFINTKERWIYPDLVRNDDPRLKYKRSITWEYADQNSFDDESGSGDTVILIAEYEQDIEILDRVQFNFIEKDQLWILFPDNKVIE